jgi:drug/metabolite transporter (DMT)-like permease
VELWIVLTVTAAFLQNLRSLLQKRATGRLSVIGASYIRFCYALPFVWLYFAGLLATHEVPAANREFLLFCVAGGFAQLLSTAALVASFGYDNFAVGTTFSKTEVAQTAVFGLLILGETLPGSAVAGVLVSFLGVLVLSNPGRLDRLLGSNRALLLGLLSGAGLAVASVSYRAAALALAEGDYLIRSGFTLAVTVSFQTLLMGAFIAARDPRQLARVAGSWRSSIWVGLAGGLASMCWFAAMTLVSAALVRALGQVELLFTFAASIWVFRERVRPREVLGAVLIVLGIWLLL